MIQPSEPTVSSTEGQQLVSPPGKGPIPPGQALYKVKWSIIFLNITYHHKVRRYRGAWRTEMRSSPTA